MENVNTWLKGEMKATIKIIHSLHQFGLLSEQIAQAMHCLLEEIERIFSGEKSVS